MSVPNQLEVAKANFDAAIEEVSLIVIFKNADELFTYLTSSYDGTSAVDISTYNMYLGISKGMDWSTRFPMAARKFIDLIPKDKLRIVLGLPRPFECTPGCPHCQARSETGEQRNVDTARMLKLNIRTHDKLHLKYYRVGPEVIIGGINLGQSDALDASIVVHDMDQRWHLMQLFDSVWESATPLEVAGMREQSTPWQLQRIEELAWERTELTQRLDEYRQRVADLESAHNAAIVERDTLRAKLDGLLPQRMDEAEAKLATRPAEAVVQELQDENRRLREALGSIAQAKECHGPDCFWCDTDAEHPSSSEAKAAQKALGGAGL